MSLVEAVHISRKALVDHFHLRLARDPETGEGFMVSENSSTAEAYNVLARYHGRMHELEREVTANEQAASLRVYMNKGERRYGTVYYQEQLPQLPCVDLVIGGTKVSMPVHVLRGMLDGLDQAGETRPFIEEVPPLAPDAKVWSLPEGTY